MIFLGAINESNVKKATYNYSKWIEIILTIIIVPIHLLDLAMLLLGVYSDGAGYPMYPEII